MMEMNAIREAMLRLSCIGCTPFHYDPAGNIFCDGPIHYIIEVGDLFFVAWESNDTGSMIVNPITRFDLDELGELGAAEAWTVLLVPAEMSEGIQFREIDGAELIDAYCRMQVRTTVAPIHA